MIDEELDRLDAECHSAWNEYLRLRTGSRDRSSLEDVEARVRGIDSRVEDAWERWIEATQPLGIVKDEVATCLLYTSDAADEL